MTTYNFDYNNALYQFLNTSNLYFRVEENKYFVPSNEEFEGILARLENQKEICGIALMWGWVQRTSEFWNPIKDKSLMGSLKRLGELYVEFKKDKEEWLPPTEEEVYEKNLNLLASLYSIQFSSYAEDGEEPVYEPSNTTGITSIQQELRKLRRASR